jgi:hypothetical protein
MSGLVTTLETNIVMPTNILAIGRDLYVSDQSDYKETTLFRITPDGTIQRNTCAHEGKHALLLNNLCRFLHNAYGIFASNDTLIVADAWHHTIFSLHPNGIITLIAGSWSNEPGTTDGRGSDARFDHPGSITAIGDTLYIADTYNNRIRTITPDGNVTTFAGSTAGYADGFRTDAKFYNPHGIVAVGRDLYVTDSLNNRIRKIAPNGIVTTIAGSDKGNQDGRLTDARFSFPTKITAIEDTLYVVDLGNRCIRSIEVGSMPTSEHRARKRNVLTELRTLPPVGAFPGGIEFQEGETRWQMAQKKRKTRKAKRSSRRTRKGT